MSEQPRDPFEGTVQLKDWFTHYNGMQYKLIAGTIEIVRDEDWTGFKVNRSESNWFAIIHGPTEKIAILGCQIRGFAEHAPNVDAAPGVVLRVP